MNLDLFSNAWVQCHSFSQQPQSSPPGYSASQWEQAYSVCNAGDGFPSLLRGFSDEEA